LQEARLPTKLAELVFKTKLFTGDRRSKRRKHWSLARPGILISEEAEELMALFTAIDEPGCPLDASRY